MTESDEEEMLALLAPKAKSYFQYFVINPQTNSLKNIWDNLIYMGLFINFILVPFTLAFERDKDHNDQILPITYTWEIIFDICFVINIVLTFFTAY